MRAVARTRRAWPWALLLALLTPLTAQADCRHFQPPDAELTRLPYYDGPGALGPLHGTLTLDCLHYTEMRVEGDRRVAIVEDDRGKVYPLRVGSYVGRDFGMLEAIHADYLLVIQVVRENGEWVEVPRRLPRRGE